MFRPSRLVLLSALVLPACLAAAELGRRVLDGYHVWALTLVKNSNSVDMAAADRRPVDVLLRTIASDVDADASWFYDRPQPIQLRNPAWAEERRIAFDNLSNYVWNAAALDEGGLQEFLKKNRGRLEEIFTFRSPKGGPYPHFRFHPEIQSGFGPTNRWGWRSREIALEKPPDVIRIAALGDSTTTVAYPAMVEHWLNLWAVESKLGVRFEVINAARPATGALDVAAIVDLELDGVDPDYLLIYGFGNGIYVADALITLPSGVVRGQPATGTAGSGIVPRLSRRVSEALAPLAGRSAAAAFLRRRVMGQRDGRLFPEPAKPATRMVFPPGLDERSPDPETIARRPSGGLMGLEDYLQALDKIDATARERNIRLFVGTFRVMAFDGMLLGKGDPGNGGTIYSQLNEQFVWPYTYAQLRRVSEFYNRTLRAWASAKGHDILPIDEMMPWQPHLYRDPIHELPAGEALHAWIVLQSLMPRIREDLTEGRRPVPARRRHQDLAQYWTIERTKVADVLDGPTAGENGTRAQ